MKNVVIPVYSVRLGACEAPVRKRRSKPKELNEITISVIHRIDTA